MTIPDYQIQVDDDKLARLTEGIKKLGDPRWVGIYIAKAGAESAAQVLKQEGLQTYPPESEANLPPVPYYIRGRGTETAAGNLFDSERLGTQFYVDRDVPNFTTQIGNRASYAPQVIGDNQLIIHAKRGWRRLRDVVEEQLDTITRIYDAWIAKAIRDLHL